LVKITPGIPIAEQAPWGNAIAVLFPRLDATLQSEAAKVLKTTVETGTPDEIQAFLKALFSSTQSFLIASQTILEGFQQQAVAWHRQNPNAAKAQRLATLAQFKASLDVVVALPHVVATQLPLDIELAVEFAANKAVNK